MLEVAAQIGTKEYRGLVEPLAVRLLEEPLDDGGDIDWLVDLVLTLTTKDMAEFSVFVHPLRERAFDSPWNKVVGGLTPVEGVRI